MEVSSCRARELSAFTLGQSLLIFKTSARWSSKDVYASLTLLLKPPGSQSGQRATLSSPPAICSSDSSFFWAIPVAGESLDWEHAAALATHPAQGLHSEMMQTCYHWLSAMRRFIPGEPWTGCWSCLKMGPRSTGFVPHCSNLYQNWSTETLRELLCSKCDAVQSKAVLTLWV